MGIKASTEWNKEHDVIEDILAVKKKIESCSGRETMGLIESIMQCRLDFELKKQIITLKERNEKLESINKKLREKLRKTSEKSPVCTYCKR